MAETDFLNVYFQFFEEFAKTVKPEDPLPIRVPSYNLHSDELLGEVIESCIQYLTEQKCPSSLFVPLITIAVEEIQMELRKKPQNVYDPLKVMQMSTSKINDICLRYKDNEKLSSLPPPVQEHHVSQHGVKHVRRKMEDRHVCLPRFNSLYNIQSSGEASYYALFDGHRGNAAACFAVSHLHQFLAESEHYPHDPVLAFREAYKKTEARFNHKDLNCGTTALAILHQHEEKRLIVSWVGDSQAMLVKQEGFLMLVDPHRPDRKDEYDRILQLGGFVAVVSGSYRVSGQLAVSRAIGDVQWKPLVSAEPEIRVVDLTGSEEFMVIGCDGLWDVVEPREVIRAVYSLVKENPDNIESISRRLVDLAKKNNSTDNISVIVVFFADPVEISKRSVEAIGPGPNNVSEGEMNTDFQTTTEKSPLVQLSNPGMNRIYEENGTHTEYVLQSKEDSDEDYGPETNIDTVDVLVSPKKCTNPFSNNTWKEGESCDDLIDYPKPDDLNMDKAINFSENMNNLLKENIENQSVEKEAISEPLDEIHVNQMNASNLANIPIPEGQDITFSNYSFGNKEFIDDTNFDKEIEKSDINVDHSFGTGKKDYFAVSNFSDFENFEKEASQDFEVPLQKNMEHDAENDLMDAKNEVLCNGNAEVYNNDKNELEKLISTLPPDHETISECQSTIEDTPANDTNVLIQSNDNGVQTNIESLQFCKEDEEPPISTMEKLDLITSSSIDTNLIIPQSPSDSENTSQKEPETPELLSPTNLPLDEKLKDDDVTDSGGEAESDDEGWKYMKVGSSAPADEQVGLVLSPEPTLESDKPTMNSPLNPNAAEFVPVSPVPTPCEMDIQKTPIRNTPPTGDIIASSPNWNNMDCVDVPDEVAFLKEISSRPSNILLENDSSRNDLEGLGCNDLNLDNKDVERDLFQNNVTAKSFPSENLVPQMEQYVSQSPVHGIALANDMTSSFIDPSTMSSENEMLKQEPELFETEKEVLEPQIHTTLNVNAVEFEPASVTEAANKLPDLLSPLPVEKDIKEAVDSSSFAISPDTNILDVDQPMSPVVESSPNPILEKTPDIETPADSTVEIPDLKPEKVESIEAPKVEEVPVVPADAAPITPEPIIKAEVQEVPSASPVEITAAAAAVAATTAAVATAATVGSAAAPKKDETKKVTATPKTSTATSKVMKSAAPPKTPLSSTKGVTSAKKSASSPLTKPTAAKSLSNSLSAPVSSKPAVSRVSSASSKTTTTRAVTSTTTPRPLARKTTPTISSTITKATTTTATKSSASKPLTAPAKTTVASKVASTAAAAPRPKPRVPSSTLTEKKASTTAETRRTEVLSKKPGTGSSTVTTTTRTTTSRPASAPIKSTTKTTVTTTRTTTAKPRTAITGVTSTTTTTTTRTVLNSRKPLSVASKDVGSKPMSKTVAKVNGLGNGNANKTNKTNKTTTTSTTASKTNTGNKTETKAENILDESIDVVENQVIENNKDINLINGISHD